MLWGLEASLIASRQTLTTRIVYKKGLDWIDIPPMGQPQGIAPTKLIYHRWGNHKGLPLQNLAVS